MDKLLSVEEALERILSSERGSALPAERISLTDALGRVLAQPVVARDDLPPFDNSSMDGYAVRAADVSGADPTRPAILRVSADIAAGDQDPPPLAAGEAMRTTTGAMLPKGADSVVPVEDTDDPGPQVGVDLPDRIEIYRAIEKGAYVRKAGQDVRRGRELLSAGHRLQPPDVAMLAAVGIARPLVFRRPRVAIFSSGDELLEPDQALGAGQIRDSNSYGLHAAVQRTGADSERLGIAADRETEIERTLERAVSSGANLILGSAGVSMGAHDYVRSALQKHGKLEVWRVDVRPGKPLAFGDYRGVPFFGLPGNPVSALVTFEIFVKPLIGRLSGARPSRPLRLAVRLEEPAESDGRESYLRAIVRRQGMEYWARLTGSQDSGVLSSLLLANALLIVPSGVRRLEPGDQATAWLTGELGEEG
jgi:molybdopterin molybdotransferase